MKEYYEFLKQIKGRWDVHMSVITLRGLHTWLGGYKQALFDHGLDKNKEFCKKKKNDFHDFVAKKLGFRESTAGWADMILATTLGHDPKTFNWLVFMNNYSSIAEEDHDMSIEKFYELLGEFSERKF